MATTTNFGWETPDDTDLVKDGALAIRTLGSAIDTSLVDLKGGTTGQVLSKASNTDMDFTWTTDASGGMTLLQTITANNTASAYTISSISSSYKHILITGVRLQEAGTNDGSFHLRFNSDTGSNYERYRHTISGVSVGENVGIPTTQFSVDGVMSQSGQQEDYAGVVQIWIHDYSNTTTFKSIFATGSSFNGGSNKKVWAQGFYKSNSAISSITITDSNSLNFLAGTFRVYGVS